MRTTLTIDNNQSFKDVVNEVLSKGLDVSVPAKPVRRKKFKQKTFKEGEPPPGVNLVKANQLVGQLEDKEFLRKMKLRK